MGINNGIFVYHYRQQVLFLHVHFFDLVCAAIIYKNVAIVWGCVLVLQAPASQNNLRQRDSGIHPTSNKNRFPLLTLRLTNNELSNQCSLINDIVGNQTARKCIEELHFFP